MSDIEIYMYDWQFHPFVCGLCTLYVTPPRTLVDVRRVGA